MTSPTTPNTWTPGKPLVMFMVPEKYTAVYAALMSKLVIDTVGLNIVELTGCIVDKDERSKAGMYLIRESNIDPISIAGLVLWGEAGDHLGFHSSLGSSCISTSVIIPDSSASIPTLCMPAIETAWEWDPDNWETAKTAFVKLLTSGRKDRDSGPYTFLTQNGNSWN